MKQKGKDLEILCGWLIKNFICLRFKIPERMVKTSQHIIGEQCIRNDDGVLAVSDEDKKIVWKSYERF